LQAYFFNVVSVQAVSHLTVSVQEGKVSTDNARESILLVPSPSLAAGVQEQIKEIIAKAKINFLI
jgi:hypothetical protein